MDGTHRFNYDHERTNITTFTYDEHGKLLGVVAPSGETLTMQEYSKYLADQQRQSDAEAEASETTEESVDKPTKEKEE